MSANKDALKLLLPIDLGGDQETDLTVDGRSLDRAQASADALLAEMFPEKAFVTLEDWERVCGLMPGPDDPLQYRRDRVVAKIREKGGLSIPYFLGLAETLGYTIAIEEPVPFMAGWGAAGDEIFAQAIESQWGVEISGVPAYQFRAGESAAGESLLWWDSQTLIEDLFNELKPAHTFVYFSYE